ncbi:MAG TPA: rhodanese-like domain-containing protein [Gemmatimonadales bacterium]
MTWRSVFMSILTLGIVAGPAAAQCGPRSLDAPRARHETVVSTAWLAANAASRDLVILHVDHDRTSYDAGHVPGARFGSAMAFAVGDFDLPPVPDLVEAVAQLGIANTTRVVLYGEPWHLGRVLLALDYLGHGDRIALLDGGLPQWRLEGRPVSRAEPPAVARAAFAPQVRRDVVVDAEWVRAHAADPRFVVIDARSAAEYEGTEPRNEPRRGHIPGARHLEWNRTFTRPADAEAGTASRLVSAERLLALFDSAGIRPGREPVFYCTVGLRASHLYFVARYLGFNPRIYDGSMNDWVRHPEFPLATGSRPGGQP